MSDQNEKKSESKFNIDIRGNVEGDANFSDKDIHVNKSVNVDKSKHTDNSQMKEVHGDEITVGNMTGNTGVAIGRGAQANVTIGGDSPAFAAILEELKNLQQTHPDINPMTLADAQAEVVEIQEKVEEGKVDEPWLERKFRTIALMGDDILDVVTKTAINPVYGVIEIVRKVAKKAREEAGLPTD